MQYSTRKSFFENEITYILDEAHLIIRDPKAETEKRLPYKNIRSINLKYVSRKNVPSVYICIITTLKNSIFQINSQHFVDVAKFEDRKDLYNPFIIAFHKKLDNLPIEFTKGGSVYIYWASILFFVLVGLGMLALAISTINSIGIGILLVTIFLFLRLKDHYTKNKPGTYHPLNIPKELLP